MKKGDVFENEFTVNDRVYEGFLDVFRDNNPLHTDEAFAQAKGFKGKVMHGNILNGFVSYFIGECLPTKDVIIHSQDIKFSKPVYLDDTLQFRAEIAEVFESVNTVQFKFHFQNSSGEKVAKGNVQIGIIA